MKKFVSVLLVFAMTLALTACGKEQTESYRIVTEENGLVMTDTMTLDAKGDKVQEITEIIEIDMSALDEVTYGQVKEVYTAIVDQYNSVEGVECTSEEEEQVLDIEIFIDATGDAVSELAELGLLSVTGNTKGISLKATGEALVNSGYEKVE